jgi:dTDP-4-amino-4,6-dideoxygalactose transaminase
MMDNREDVIPFFRYCVDDPRVEEQLVDVFRDVVRRGAFILQDDLRAFEHNLASFVGARAAVGVANGTDAILLALRVAGVGRGDEVILPSDTYVATAAAVHFAGAVPVLVDCGDDHLMDPPQVDAALTSRTRAILPVHLNGRTCDMEPIMKIADANDLLVVEDAAQALGSRYLGRCAGTFGVAGTFSFYPAKILGCLGDGGAVVTDDAQVAERLTAIRDHGRNDDGVVGSWGVNSRLDNLQAAILNLRLEDLARTIAYRRRIARLYQEGLGEFEQLLLPPGPEDDVEHFDVYQNYEVEADRRDDLREHLRVAGISTMVQWGGRAVHQLEGLGFSVCLPRTEVVFERSLMLPMNTSLSDREIDRICASVRSFYGSNA